MRRPEIDDEILSYVNTAWKKVAFVVAKIANESSVSFSGEEDDYTVVAQHIELLVSEGRLLAQGNLKDWRHSEVCKP